MALYDEKLWVLGGRDNSNQMTNDIWTTGGPNTLGTFFLYKKQN